LSMGIKRKDDGRRRSGRSADTGLSLYRPKGVRRKCGRPICARRGRFVRGMVPGYSTGTGRHRTLIKRLSRPFCSPNACFLLGYFGAVFLRERAVSRAGHCPIV